MAVTEEKRMRKNKLSYTHSHPENVPSTVVKYVVQFLHHHMVVLNKNRIWRTRSSDNLKKTFPYRDAKNVFGI